MFRQSAAIALVVVLLPVTARAESPRRGVATTSADWEPGPPPSSRPPPYVAPPERDQEDRLLLGGPTRHGGYGAPEMKVTSMTGEGAILVGGQGGWIINHAFVVGAAGYGLATEHTAPATLSRVDGRSTIQLGYGGPRVSYILRPHDPVHFTFGMLIGAGGYAITTREYATNARRTHDTAAFLALEPQVEAEANLLRHLRIAIGLAYRYIGATDTPGMKQSDLSGVAGSVLVKAGVF